MSEVAIPNSFYFWIGFAVVANFSSLIAFAVFIFKVGVFVSETKNGIKDSKASSVRAHKRIDDHVEQLHS